MKFSHIDSGREFDWSKSSAFYAKYRDIYPSEFYERLRLVAGIRAGTAVLDIGTGTGVIPRNLYSTGAHFTGIDVSQGQITEAKKLAENSGMDIQFVCGLAEEADFDGHVFDAITACQCFTYFNHSLLLKRLSDLLCGGGSFTITYMGWLPYEDEIARRSEELILKYNPSWSGFGDKPQTIKIPDIYFSKFRLKSEEVFKTKISFTRESWHGRILSCRGVSASLSHEKVAEFSREHTEILCKIAPQKFAIKHYIAITSLEKL